jgi:DNA polymerase-3 subunit delta
MIVKSQDGDRFAANPPQALRAALFFGPDLGLVHERADRLAATVCADLRDPFRIAELDDATLAQDRARLCDEAQAISFTGGRRVVRVRGAGNGLAGVFAAFLEGSKGDALVVVESGELAKGAKLRDVFEEAKHAAAVQCYPDSQETLGDLVRSALKSEDIAISREALDAAVSLLGPDRGMARRQIDKLALYALGGKRVEVEDVRAVMGDEAEARTEEVCDLAGEGELAKLDRAIERLWAANISPVAILRVAMGHFQKLALARAPGGPGPEAAMKRYPQIHFSRAASFRAQVRRWSEPQLQDALDLLLDTEALCKTTAVPAEAVCARALFNVAAMARARG